MVIIQSEEHLNQIEQRDQKKKNRKFDNVDFMSVEHQQNAGKLKMTPKLDDWKKPPEPLDDGKNKKLA